MRKIILKPGTRNEIDVQVEKILRGLGNPEPPLDLDAVFKLQQLDPQYYLTSEDGVVRESISRVKVGAKLFFEKPTRIWEAIKTANLKALWIPEQKRILVDGSLHELKKRWNFAHEIGHSIIDWHRDFTFGDDQLTLVEGYHIGLCVWQLTLAHLRKLTLAHLWKLMGHYGVEEIRWGRAGA